MSTLPLKYESSNDGVSMTTVNSESSSSSSPFWTCPPAIGQSHVKIPFSWEQEPGVPKHKIHSVRTSLTRSMSRPIPNDHHDHYHHHHLRPPPMLLSKPSEPKQKKKVKSDPFVAAMVECTKHEKKKDRSKNRSTSIFSWMSTCSTSESEVIVPRSKQLDRPRSSRSNQVLDVDPTTKISMENIKQYGSAKHFAGKENRQRQPKALVEWVNGTDIELYHTLLERDHI